MFSSRFSFYAVFWAGMKWMLHAGLGSVLIAWVVIGIGPQPKKERWKVFVSPGLSKGPLQLCRADRCLGHRRARLDAHVIRTAWAEEH